MAVLTTQPSILRHRRLPSPRHPPNIRLHRAQRMGRPQWCLRYATVTRLPQLTAGLFMSFTMTGVITQVIKLMVGRPRPDLIARCLPKEGAHDHPVFGLSTDKICTQTNFYVLNDGFKVRGTRGVQLRYTRAQLTGQSFPSGHSSRKCRLGQARGWAPSFWFLLPSCSLLPSSCVWLSSTVRSLGAFILHHLHALGSRPQACSRH